MIKKIKFALLTDNITVPICNYFIVFSYNTLYGLINISFINLLELYLKL